MNACLLIFELQASNNPGSYPIPCRVGIKCRQHRQIAYPRAMQMKLLSIWCLHRQQLVALLVSNGHEQRTTKRETVSHQFWIPFGRFSRFLRGARKRRPFRCRNFHSICSANEAPTGVYLTRIAMETQVESVWSVRKPSSTRKAAAKIVDE